MRGTYGHNCDGLALLCIGVLLCLRALVGCAGSPLPLETRSPGPVPGKHAYERRDALEEAPEFGGLVYVVDAGPQDAPPLLLIHGFGDNASRDFEPILPELCAHFRVLTFDLPGFGRSSRTEQLYSPARYVRFIRAMVERRFETPVSVLGHSMGGALAIQYAGDYPQDVARLALLDVAGVLHYRDYILELNAGDRSQHTVADSVWVGIKELLLGPPMALTSIESLDLESGTKPPSFLSLSATTAMLFISHNFGPALHRITAPTWLGWGRSDTVAPQRTAIALRYALSPAQDVLFEQSGHVPMQTEPARLAQSLLAFLVADPIAEAPPREPMSEARVGTCVGQRDQMFEGDFASIYIRNCADVLLRDVRTRRLWVERSRVELERVEVTGPDAGATFKEAEVLWTGGHIQAQVCASADGSELNLAAVRCEATRQALDVYGGSQLRASVSRFEVGGDAQPVHGELEFGRNAEGHTPEWGGPAPVEALVNAQPRPPGRRWRGASESREAPR